MTVALRTPVVLSVFNRPTLAGRVFQRIAAAAPSRLYVFADGPRRDVPTDPANCAAVRAIVEKVTWPCDLRLNIADHNMGCKARTISGLDWVFEQETEIIFFEDDTLPDLSFFTFCDEMLSRYREDSRVSSICGSQLVRRKKEPYSYFFSRLPGWGRGVWRRSWAGFDGTMSDWPDIRDSGILSNVFMRKSHQDYWIRIMNKAYSGGVDSWSYPYILTCWMQNRLNIIPAQSLVDNLGFGSEATHTKIDPGYGEITGGSLEFPLRHPPFVLPDRLYDDRAVEFQLRQSSLVARVRRRCAMRY
jgi:hypothetical protein